MPVTLKIEGLDDCLKCLNDAPENVQKMTESALRTASEVAIQHIKNGIPEQFQRLVDYRLVKLPNGRSLWIGLFNKDKSRRRQNSVLAIVRKRKTGKSQMDDWFKAYWMNYGTLKHRDPSHKFRDEIRVNRPKRNEEGQPHKNFFEESINGWQEPFMDAFERAMAEQQDKLYD